MGASLERKDLEGRTPLLIAADNGVRHEAAATSTVRMLLDAGADIEARDMWDETPFLKACKRGSLAITRLLVERGCDLAAISNDGGYLYDACTLAKGNGSEFERYVASLYVAS
jgi:ankyrin repeat protein